MTWPVGIFGQRTAERFSVPSPGSNDPGYNHRQAFNHSVVGPYGTAVSSATWIGQTLRGWSRTLRDLGTFVPRLFTENHAVVQRPAIRYLATKKLKCSKQQRSQAYPESHAFRVCDLGRDSGLTRECVPLVEPSRLFPASGCGAGTPFLRSWPGRTARKLPG